MYKFDIRLKEREKMGFLVIVIGVPIIFLLDLFTYFWNLQRTWRYTPFEALISAIIGFCVGAGLFILIGVWAIIRGRKKKTYELAENYIRYFENDKLKIEIEKDNISKIIRFHGHPKYGRYKKQYWVLNYKIFCNKDKVFKLKFDYLEMKRYSEQIYEFFVSMENFCEKSDIEFVEEGKKYFFGEESQ